jgi:hypothetical protein
MIRYILLLTLLHGGLAAGQTTEETLTKIRKWYVETEGRQNGCVVNEVYDWFDETAAEGSNVTLKGYYDNSESSYIKIVETLGGPYYEESKEYFMRQGELFFYYSKGYRADQYYTAEESGMTEEEMLDYGAQAKTLLAFEHRIYFQKGEVIKHLIKERVYPADESDFDMSSQGYIKGDLESLDGSAFVEHVEQMRKALP